MSNPYLASSESNNASAAARTPFQQGFYNGTRWSLTVAVPSAALFFGEFWHSATLRIDPVTRIGTSEPASAVVIVLLVVAAIGTSLSLITLPWALVAGWVQHTRG